MITHEEQQKIWDEEHKNPKVLLQMDSPEVSGGVEKFWEFLVEQDAPRERGVEMGCGKGRNIIWLARQGVEVYGFDFSPAAIEEAKRRAADISNAHFLMQDATKPWTYEDASFDFAIDCFALTDIESTEGRTFAISEFRRVLKPGGYLLAYLLSTDDTFHEEMMRLAPGDQQNSFFHPTGKFEKVFDEAEIRELYKDFAIATLERMEKTAIFNGEGYACRHFWLVLQKIQ